MEQSSPATSRSLPLDSIDALLYPSPLVGKQNNLPGLTRWLCCPGYPASWPTRLFDAGLAVKETDPQQRAPCKVDWDEYKKEWADKIKKEACDNWRLRQATAAPGVKLKATVIAKCSG